MSTRVSVVLPTRNRCAETLATIQTVLSSTHDDLVLHVFDNNSHDETQDAVLSLEDERIDYHRSETTLAVTDSFEAAYSCAQGSWVTGLGADDGLTSIAIQEMLEMALANQTRAVSTAHASFHWPGVTSEAEGRLHVRAVAPDTLLLSRNEVRRVLANKAKFQDLPTAYKSGMVHHSVLGKIRRRYGRLFNSVNPDVFLGFAVAHATPSFFRSGRPLTISGTSRGSTGWSTLGGGDDSSAMEEFYSLSRDSRVTLDARFRGIGADLPRHILLMQLEAYLKVMPAPRGIERALSSPMFQLGLLLSDSRRPSQETLQWAKEYAEAHGSSIGSRARWIAARAISREQAWRRAREKTRQKQRTPKAINLAPESASDLVRLARTHAGTTLFPAPPTVAQAARLLDQALAKDLASR